MEGPTGTGQKEGEEMMYDQYPKSLILILILIALAFSFVCWLAAGEFIIWILGVLSLAIDEVMFRTLWWTVGYGMAMTRAVVNKKD